MYNPEEEFRHLESSRSYRAYLKSPFKSIKHTTYFGVYDKLLENYRGKDITFLEIGILGGGSLFMWREFFGPNARIIGVDINPAAKKWEKYGFDIVIGSQSDPKFWEELYRNVGKVDVLLDDGGHTYEQQIITVEHSLPIISSGGLIIVEDTHTSYIDGFGPKRYSFIQYVKNMIDSINMRFSEFSAKEAEMRIHSIEVFESMIAFHVAASATQLFSSPTSNGGDDDLAMNLTRVDNSGIRALASLGSRFPFLKKIPFAQKLNRFLRIRLGNRKFSARGYFK